MRQNMRLIVLLAVAIASSLTLAACGGGGGGNQPTTNDLVIVPGSASVPVSQSGQFTAFLAGAPQSATWTASRGTIDNSGLFMAPSSPGSVTLTATSGTNSGTTTVQVVAAQPVSVSPAVLGLSAGAMQAFTATPAAGVSWSVNGLAGGDCVTPPFNTTNQCHGTITGAGVYTAPLSPPSGGTVTITATSGANSGTATATILYSSASLTTNGSSGQYAMAFAGVDLVQGNPLDVAGSITTSGTPGSTSGTITGGEIDINSFVTAGLATDVAITGGTYQVGPIDGRTTMTVTVASNPTTIPSFTLQVTIGSNLHSLLVDFDTFATGSGTLDAQNPVSFGPILNGNFAFGFSGVDTNYNPLVASGTFLASSLSIPINSVNAPTNVQDLEDISFSTPVVTNDQTLAGSYTAADASGRGTITMTSTPLGTINLAYYMTDATHLKILEIDPSQTFVVTGDVFSAPALPTGMTGGVALTFGGLANNASYAGGAVFTISTNTVKAGGAMDINNFGAGSSQSNNPITSGSYSASTGSGVVPARYLLTLTNNKGSNQFAAYTFTSGGQTGAEIVEIDTNNGVQGASGTAYQQGSLSTSPQGSYALNLTGVGFAKSSGSFEQDLGGQIGLTTGSTTITGTLDFNNPANNGSPFSGLPVNSTSTITAAASNGRGTMLLKTSAGGLPANFDLVYYIVNGNTVLLFDSDSNRVANGTLTLQY
ncbi:MAG: hypothetical protein WBY38_17705 [Candidatus Acidiferrales bacterium]